MKRWIKFEANYKEHKLVVHIDLAFKRNHTEFVQGVSVYCMTLKFYFPFKIDIYFISFLSGCQHFLFMHTPCFFKRKILLFQFSISLTLIFHMSYLKSQDSRIFWHITQICNLRSQKFKFFLTFLKFHVQSN